MAGSGPRRRWHKGDTLPGGYQVRDIKHGGMGIVYLTYNPHFRLPFAVKTFQDKYLTNRKAVKRFHREARTWIKLKEHPNIVHAFFVDKIDGKPHIFLEYVQGEPLKEHLGCGALDPHDALSIALQICRGMAHAHNELGIVHRDLKPSNVLLDNRGFAKVTDLGLVKVFDEADSLAGQAAPRSVAVGGSDLTRAGVAMGTPAYMAPEQWEDAGRVDTRADIFSFGVLLYEMLCGTRPFRPKDLLSPDASKEAGPEPRPRPIASFCPALPRSLDAPVLRCLERDPARRYGGFDEVSLAIEHGYRLMFGESWEPPEQGPAAERRPTANNVLKGMSLATLGDHEGAIQLFDQALQMEPKNARALSMKGRSVWALGDHNKGVDLIRKSALLDPTDGEAYDSVAFCLNEMGRHDTALAYAEKAVEHDRDSFSAWNNRAIALSHLRRAEEAETSFRRALELNPTSTEAWNNLGHLLQRAGRTAEAIACFQRSIRLDPWHTKSYFNYALLLCHAGRFSEAKSVMDELLLIDSENEAAWGLRAAIMQDLQRQGVGESGRGLD